MQYHCSGDGFCCVLCCFFLMYLIKEAIGGFIPVDFCVFCPILALGGSQTYAFESNLPHFCFGCIASQSTWVVRTF